MNNDKGEFLYMVGTLAIGVGLFLMLLIDWSTL